MIEDDASLLEEDRRFPDRLEATMAGLGASDLDLTQDDDGTIRPYVQHLVEGESIWQVHLRAMVETDGIPLPYGVIAPFLDFCCLWQFLSRTGRL